MRKSILSLFVMMCLFGVVAFASSAEYVASNIASVKSQRIDGQCVMLEGQVVNSCNDGNFIFRDDTGDIVMDVMDRYDEAQEMIGVPIRVYGAVHADFYAIRIDAYDIEVL